MTRRIPICACILFGFSLAASAAITTIVDTTGGASTLSPYIGGTGGDLTAGEIVGMSWTQTSSYTNVNIAVSVRSIDTTHPNVTAILTNAIGAGTTAANVIATSTVAVTFAVNPIYPLVTFFNGLSLPAGTYYLILVGDPNAVQGVQNVSDGDATPVLANGVTLSGTADQFAAEPSTGLGTIDPSFVPDSNFFFFGRDENAGRLVVQITSGTVPPTISKAFGAASIILGASTSLTFNIADPNSTSLTNLSFTDTLPAGLQFVTPFSPTLSADCTGFTTTGSTAAELMVSGLQLGGGKTCTATFTVLGVAAGGWHNTTSAISSTEGGIGTTSNTAAITVIAPPSISKSFGAATIPLNGSTSLSFTIGNLNIVGLAGIAFTDTLPSGLVVSTPNGLTGSCGAGTITATAGSGLVSLSGAGLAFGTDCTFSVNVTGIAAGVMTNSVQVTSTTAGAGNTWDAHLTVVAPPSITKSFGAATVPVGGSTTLSFTITNPNSSTSLTGVAFTDTLPAGLIVSTPSGVSGNCGIFTATAGSSSVTLAPSTLGPSASCNLTVVNVTGVTRGVLSNSVTVTSTNGGTGNTATAGLTVVAPPSISKSFGAASIPLGGSTTLSFTITNPNASTSLTGVAFTDSLPAGLIVSTPSGVNGNCGIFTATAGSSLVTLSPSVLAPSATCNLTVVNVTGIASGVQNNSVTVTSSNGGTGNTATASLTVAAPPSLSKSFGAASIPVGSSTSLSFTVSNPGADTSLTSVAFTDSLPAGLVVSTPNGLIGSCAGGTITATAGSSSVSLAGATLATTTSCMFSVSVTGINDGVQNNSVTVSSDNGGAGNTATASITVFRAPTIQKSFGAAQIFQGQSTSLTFTLNSPNENLTLTGVSFSDTLPDGLVVSTPSGEATTCSGTVTAVSGGNSVSLTGATLSPAETCTVSVNVTAIAAGSLVNTTSTLISDQATPGSAAMASIVVFPTFDSPFQVSYAADPSAGESYINLVNNGANGDALLGPGFGTQTGNICVNAYAFSPDEQLISCCSCLLTPNAVANLGVSRDLTSTTLTGVIPTSVVIKLVTTLPAGGNCKNSAATEGTLVNGLVAYGSTPQPAGTTYSAVEHTFTPSSLSESEYASITGRCASIIGNGSGFGICGSCRSGALGAQKQ